MIIVKVTDGLGNQMFQYAFARYLQEHTGMKVFLDIHDINRNDDKDDDYIRNWMSFCESREYKLDSFCINVPVTKSIKHSISHKKKYSSRFMRYCQAFHLLPDIYVSEFDEKIEDVRVRKFHNYYFTGSFFNSKWLMGMENILYKEFSLIDKSALKEWIDLLDRKETVSIHIRRGDFLNVGRNISEGEYYKRAIEKIVNEVRNPFYLIFTDDKEWVKDNLQLGNSIIVSGNGLTDNEELILMSKCRHNIIANSTFSFWGAWLNQNPKKVVVYPHGWRRHLMSDSWYGV